MGKTSAAVKNRYAAKAYDRIALQVKKGEKDKIKARADSLGMSLNAFITEAIEHSMRFYQEQEERLTPGRKWYRTEEGKAAIARLGKAEDEKQ